jgi:hypothetical protein
VSRRLPPQGTRVRARLYFWDEVQANNTEQFPDPSLPTLEGMPEYVQGELQIRHVKSRWGAYTAYSITTDDYSAPVDVDKSTIERCGPA